MLDPCEGSEVKKGKEVNEVKKLMDADLDIICEKYGDVKRKRKAKLLS